MSLAKFAGGLYEPRAYGPAAVHPRGVGTNRSYVSPVPSPSMALCLVKHVTASRSLVLTSDICLSRKVPRRFFFSYFKKRTPPKLESQPILSQDDLFHPFSQSPFPAVRARGEAIRSLAPCPVCAAGHDHVHAHTKASPRAVAFECPDCGWPTHCSEEHWAQDEQHEKYCFRLREVNEDEHDLRSGRRLKEFELPGV